MSRPVAAIVQMWRVVARTQLSRVRLAVTAGAGVALVAVTTAVAAAGGDGAEVVTQAGLGLFVPLIAVVFAVSALGDLDADGGLVYLWMHPVPRWQLTAGALAGVATVVVPAVAVPMAAAGVAAGLGGAAAGVAGVAVGAALAYSAVFLAVGLRLARALLWGLLYVLVWEGPLSAASATLARLSVQWHATAALDRFAPVEAHPSATGAALALFVAAGVAATTWTLRRYEPA